jgi:hypothetical protein
MPGVVEDMSFIILHVPLKVFVEAEPKANTCTHETVCPLADIVLTLVLAVPADHVVPADLAVEVSFLK